MNTLIKDQAEFQGKTNVSIFSNRSQSDCDSISEFEKSDNLDKQSEDGRTTKIIKTSKNQQPIFT